MRLATVLAIIASVMTIPAPPQPGPIRTMRVDYFHTGGATPEVFALDEVVVEPAAWAGRRTPEDPLGYGADRFEVRETGSNRLVFANGFGSIYDEWTTTEEAAKTTRTFHESVRFPAPSSPVTLTIQKRGARNAWRDVWTVGVDPADMFVNTATPDPDAGPVIEIEKHGDSGSKVDLLLL